MASSSFVCLAIGTLLFFHVATAYETQRRASQGCRLDRLMAMQPNRHVESEAGVSEYWDLENYQDLQCAGVSAVRLLIQRRGLLLPSFKNTPSLYYVVQGRGIEGAVIPGCPETYESGESGQQSQEKHQKIRQIKQGDIVATPAGVAKWLYNNGDNPLILISFMDVGNQANQLDFSARRFHLAGNPQRDQTTEQESRRKGWSYGLERERSITEQTKSSNGNLFSGFHTNVLAEAFRIDTELARKLQSQDDRRERIVRVRGEELHVLSPATLEREDAEIRSRSEYGYGYGYYNGVEETFCSLKLRRNIDLPSQADIFNPRGGRITTVTSFDLPILRALRLTAERGVLYKNALMTPHFNLNSHSVIYCTRGNGRVEVVDDFGRNVFNGELHEGQLLVVPQNFAVVKKASERGFEWIAVKTNDNAMRAPLAGRVSAIRAMPDAVLANAFRISKEQARRLKFGRDEVTVFTPEEFSTSYPIMD